MNILNAQGQVSTPAECCEKCKYVAEENGEFFCRRYPPTMQIIQGMKMNALGHPQPTQNKASFQPSVMKHQWCGEFEKTIYLNVQ